MVLSSQAQRRGTRSYVSSYRRRKQKRLRLWAGTILVLAIVGYIAWSWIGHSGSDTTGPGAAVAKSGSAASVAAPLSSDAMHGSTPPAAPAHHASVVTPPVKPAPKSTPPSHAAPTPTVTAPAQTTAAAEPPAPAADTSPDAARLIAAGQQMIQQGQKLKARELLNTALTKPLAPNDAAQVRQLLGQLNEDLVFSPKVTPGDPWTDTYVVKSGDVLTNIAKQYNTPWEFISVINGNLDPRRLRPNMRLKVVKGPFHAVVDKSDFRLDIYLGKPGPGGLFVRSFKVALGRYDATPLGMFIVKPHSKLKNPEWTNPRTGEKYLADDPRNPLGEYWVGLEGTDPNTEVLKGYGIHGTIEPDSIGKQASMGCVRMLADDIKLVYAMLSEGQSKVMIVQ